MDETGLTAKQVASRIARADSRDEITFVARQIRHWTNEGILRAIGDVHPGPGRARRYSERTVYVAAFLAELTKYKMPVTIMIGFRSSLLSLSATILKQRRYDPFNIAVEGKRSVYFLASWEQVSVRGLSYASRAELDPETLDFPSDASSIVVLNLTQIFGRVRR